MLWLGKSLEKSTSACSKRCLCGSQARAAHAGVGAPAAASLRDAASGTAAHARALRSSLASALRAGALRAAGVVQPAAAQALAALRSAHAGATRLLDPGPNPSVWRAPAHAGAEVVAGAEERPAARQALAAWLSRFGRCFRSL